jgi:hypothetical protein
LGDLPLPDEVREEWSTFLQRQAQQKRKLYLHICLSGGVAAAIALLLLLWSPWHITDKDSILQNIEIFTALHAPEQITTIEPHFLIANNISSHCYVRYRQFFNIHNGNNLLQFFDKTIPLHQAVPT